MSFSQMLEILRGKNKGKIVFINAGAFYIAIEEDAVLLNKELQLKCNCFQKHTCKVGVPINSINKYLEKLEKSNYSYIVYKIEKEKEELITIREYKGKMNKVETKNINCLLCKGIDIYKDDKYMQAVRKLYEKQQ